MTQLSTNTRAELADRSTQGLDVTLVWLRESGEDKAVVLCLRHTGGCVLRDPDGAVPRPRGLLPPFAHRDFSTVDYEGHRLAA
jgi:hypothetical protein